MMTVETRNLTLRYGETTALDRLSFALDSGKIYGLLGRNGSGKTTLLSILAASRKADEGDVLIDGEPVFENPTITRQIALIRESVDVPDTDDPIERTFEFAAFYRPNWDADYAAHLIEEVARIFEEVVIIDKGWLVLHEPVETLTARGATVTGPAEHVAAFAATAALAWRVVRDIPIRSKSA